MHAATANADTASVTFYGTGITYYAETNSDEGTITVSLDGTPKGTVSANTATRQAQQALYTVTSLPIGPHTLTLTKKSGAYMLADRFDIQ